MCAPGGACAPPAPGGAYAARPSMYAHPPPGSLHRNIPLRKLANLSFANLLARQLSLAIQNYRTLALCYRDDRRSEGNPMQALKNT